MRVSPSDSPLPCYSELSSILLVRGCGAANRLRMLFTCTGTHGCECRLDRAWCRLVTDNSMCVCVVCFLCMCLKFEQAYTMKIICVSGLERVHAYCTGMCVRQRCRGTGAHVFVACRDCGLRAVLCMANSAMALYTALFKRSVLTGVIRHEASRTRKFCRVHSDSSDLSTAH